MALTAEQVFDKEKIKELTDITNDIYSGLVTNNGGAISKLPENIFASYFLPYFAGTKDPATFNKIVAEWIGVAGSPRSKVEVIDNSGITLFTVPELFDSSVIDAMPKEGEHSFRQIFDLQSLYGSNIKASGNTYLIKALETKFLKISGPNANLTENEKIWADIFNRYNIKAVDTASISGVNQAGNISSDELSYD